MHRLLTSVTNEAMADDDPTLVLIQGENRVRVGLHDVKVLIEALTDEAAELVTVQVGSVVEDEGITH